MSYERMWDPEPPTPEERLEAQIKASSGVIVGSTSDVPPAEHWAILRYGIFSHAPLTCVVYQDKTRWADEVRRLAVAGEVFTALAVRPVSTKVTVSVDVDIEPGRGT